MQLKLLWTIGNDNDSDEVFEPSTTRKKKNNDAAFGFP